MTCGFAGVFEGYEAILIFGFELYAMGNASRSQKQEPGYPAGRDPTSPLDKCCVTGYTIDR